MNSTTTTDASSSSSKKNKWFPLESNPALMNDYIQQLGFDTSLYEFVDVFSFEDWALDMIPQPVAAVLVLYPLTDKLEHRPQPVAAKDDSSVSSDSNVWFIKQRIGNACGTIGLLHALLNVAPVQLQQYAIRPDSWLAHFAHECPTSMDPVSKAERLEANDTIASLHDAATSNPQFNQTSRGNRDDDIDTHFMALVCVQNALYELDGRQAGPIRHASNTNISPDTLLKEACRVVQTRMQQDPTEMRFTILALAPTQRDDHE